MSPRVGKILIPVMVAVCCLAVTLFYVREPLGNRFFEKGLEAKKEWRLDEAISYFTWAVRLGGRKIEADFERALCYQLQGDFQRSQKELDRLLSEEILKQELRSRILHSNGINLFNQNQAEKALETHRESLKIARLINNKKLEARSLIGLSRVLYHTKGEFDEAAGELEKALRLGRETGDELIVADALRNTGVVLWWGKGELDRPLEEFYRPALEIYRRHKDFRSEATMLSNIALIHSFKGDGFEYLKLQNESLAIRKKIGDQAGLSESYQALGVAYFSVGNLRKAREYFLRSVELSKKIGFHLTKNESETYLAGAYVKLGEYDEAIRLFSEILEREKESPELAKVRLGSIANCYLLKGDFRRARDIFEQVLTRELGKDSRDIRSLSAIYIYLGEVYLKLGENEKAGEVLQKAEELYTRYGANLIQGLLGYSVTQAEYSFQRGDYEKSRQFLNKAAEDELNLFASSGTNVTNHPLTRNYDRLFTLLLEKLNKKNASGSGGINPVEELAFRFLEQRRYRSFRNFIISSSNKNISKLQAADANEKTALKKIGELTDRIKAGDPDEDLKKRLYRAYGNYENAVFQNQFSETTRRAIRDVRPAGISQIRQNLDEKTALIEYLFAGEKVFALVLTKEGLKSFPLPVSRRNLQNKISLLEASLFSKDEDKPAKDPALWQPLAGSLREGLIEPVEEMLEDKTRLGIVPFGFLHDLPFAALISEKNGAEKRFLIEDYVLYYPPSASFLAVKKERPETGANLISFGRNAAGRTGLSPLNFAAAEAETVARIFSGRARLENEASETAFKSFAGKVTHLHIAAHAVAEPEMPLFSRLLLQPTAEDDGNLTTREIFRLGLKTDLVTIAACEGAKSFSADAEGLIEIDRTGLAEAFLYAGSKSVLASLSPASDRVTGELMKDFYVNLRQNRDKAASLAQAQREMLHRNGNESFGHPKYWANFVLIGADR